MTRWRLGGGRRVAKEEAENAVQRTLPPPPPSSCLPFVMHPPHLQSCHWLVRTNHGAPRCLPAAYQFGQDDIKFLVLGVKDHMRTDVLITGLPCTSQIQTLQTVAVPKQTCYLYFRTFVFSQETDRMKIADNGNTSEKKNIPRLY